MLLVASALERAGKRSPAVLRLWARAKAIPGEARLALNRFPTRCIRNYYLDRVLGIHSDTNCPNIFVSVFLARPAVSVREFALSGMHPLKIVLVV